MISVLVAVVGVLGTALGASLTAIIAAHTENRRQAALDRQQARQELTHRDNQALEVRVEHLRWRRARRQSAYLDFLDALNAADRANQQYFRDRRAASGPVPVQEARVAEIRQLFKDAEQRGNRVLLEGPAAVAEAAFKLIGVQGALVREVQEFGEAQSASADDAQNRASTAEETGLKYLVAHREFISVARAALDEFIDAS
ncbi:hypothetical protein ACIP5Y_07660 [Nocardia sp. NPDC088792]|uniref:hypothetical protein n=1 Tax=Nocardia sp. NPDC088792 TaxID=3364332 RepID=UPI0038194B9E